MSRLALHHPEEGTLLQYLDGEVGRREARDIHAHLEACWQCRTALEDLQVTVNDCVRYRKQVLIPSMPEPPAAWGSLDFARVDAELAAESFKERLGRWLSPRRSAPMRWALTGALAVALSFVIVRQLRETPNVEAAALLRKAVEISDARPRTVKRLRILSSRGPMARTVGVTSVRPAAGEAEIARLFETAHYDWNDPLSARSYAAWHDALLRKVDEVSSADPAVYRIKTTTSDSELLSATLKLRKTDFAPLEGRFEFRNRDWVEITELVDQLNLPASTVAGAAGGAPRQPGVPPGPSSPEPSFAIPPAADAPGPNEELQVVAALHQVGADLGDPLEITREGRDVVVTGTGIAPARQNQIHNQLDRLPHVVVRFTDPTFPASRPAAEPAPTRDAAVPAGKSTDQARIEQRLGGRPQFERFSGQLLDWTESALGRAYALHRLAQQFPVTSTAAMGSDDRRTLHALGRDHLAAMQQDLSKIKTTVVPVLHGIGATAARPEARPAAAAWQPASEQMLASARRVETLLAVVLGVAPATSTTDAPAQLLTALSQLTSDIEQCQRLLSYD
jgi:hypothetical protein